MSHLYFPVHVEGWKGQTAPCRPGTPSSWEGKKNRQAFILPFRFLLILKESRISGFFPKSTQLRTKIKTISDAIAKSSLALLTTVLMLVFSYSGCVGLFETLWSVAHQVPLSMEFSRQEHWSALPCPPSRDLPHPGVESASQADSLPAEPPGKPFWI